MLEKPKPTYALLKGVQVILGEGIRPCHDRDEVDPGAQTLHDLDVQGLETGRDERELTGTTQRYLRVTGGTDKVQTSMYPEVNLLLPLGLLLLTHVRFMLVVNEVDNGSP